MAEEAGIAAAAGDEASEPEAGATGDADLERTPA
jgi:hypothetical protein